MENQRKNPLVCQGIGYKHSLAYWAGEITEMTEIAKIMELLETIYKRSLIDRSDAQSVQTSDSEAHKQINTHLLEMRFPADEIAQDYLERNLFELFNNLIEIAVQRRNLHELGLLIILLNTKRELLPDKRLRNYYLSLIKTTIAHDNREEPDEHVDFDTADTLRDLVRSDVEELYK